ncbi:unnamed protein product [Urochloa decumbens]|uniref:Interferon-related developmental regulator N-terminal domain-containing protein n=1 Tax=Urochloa decumbens TaxID=240449 RepID=A0ABC9ENV4_9POAL
MARNGNPENYELVIDECIRLLQDRIDYYQKIKPSPATHEAAMAWIVGELERHLPFEELDMSKGTRNEARHAYRAVGLLLLTLRDGSPGPLLDEAFPALSKTIQGQTDAPPALVAAAIDCLAAASFAAARHTERSMEAIWRVVVPPARSRSAAKLKKIQGAPETSPVVLAAAVSAWTFLLTTVIPATNTRQRKADRAGWSAAVASLAKLLDADDRRVRMAAGEALAVCVELNLLTEGKDMDALAAKASDLAADSASKGANNAFLREQKELFGRIAAFLDHDEPPATSVRTSLERHGVMKVSTWVRLVQLNFLRRFLGKGFLKHAQSNPLLNEAFRLGRVEGKPLSVQNKGSGMTIDDLLRDLNSRRDWHSWDCYNIFDLPRVVGITERWLEMLLQLGWH